MGNLLKGGWGKKAEQVSPPFLVGRLHGEPSGNRARSKTKKRGRGSQKIHEKNLKRVWWRTRDQKTAGRKRVNEGGHLQTSRAGQTKEQVGLQDLELVGKIKDSAERGKHRVLKKGVLIIRAKVKLL